MPIYFTVLASGSAGNASLVEVDGGHLLIDAGIGPRVLGSRLRSVGSSWERILAVLLTHTHSDHWRDKTLQRMVQLRIPIYCHDGHHGTLVSGSHAFRALDNSGLVHTYQPGNSFVPVKGLKCKPFSVPHDSGPTFGFRLDLHAEGADRIASLAYLADLGTWDDELIQHTADVDLLALEFNHDVEMLRTSGRPSDLIERIMGNHGHLSNAQASLFLKQWLQTLTSARRRHLVQLHLSRECNLPKLAHQAAHSVLRDEKMELQIHSAAQDVISPRFCLGEMVSSPPQPIHATPKKKQRTLASQPMLPGLELNW